MTETLLRKNAKIVTETGCPIDSSNNSEKGISDSKKFLNDSEIYGRRRERGLSDSIRNLSDSKRSIMTVTEI